MKGYENLFNPPKYVSMDTRIDGSNPFILLERFRETALKQGWTEADIDKVILASKTKDYQHLIDTIMYHIL